MRRYHLYLLLDGLFRLEDQLFVLEDQVRRSIRVQFDTAQMRTSSVWGAALGGVIAIVPTILSAAGDTWNSLPARIFYAACVLMAVVWAWQIFDARRSARQLGLMMRRDEHEPLWQRDDYLLEQVAMFGTRIRLLWEALEQDARHPPQEAQADDAALPAPRLREVLADCRQRIVRAVEQSDRLQRMGKRTSAQHALLLEWASPYLPPAGRDAGTGEPVS